MIAALSLRGRTKVGVPSLPGLQGIVADEALVVDDDGLDHVGWKEIGDADFHDDGPDLQADAAGDWPAVDDDVLNQLVVDETGDPDIQGGVPDLQEVAADVVPAAEDDVLESLDIDEPEALCPSFLSLTLPCWRRRASAVA